MRRARFLAPWKDSAGKPSIYHCVSRVVDRRFVFGDREREAFRMFMRMQENFTGCRVLTYCVMSNHFHILLEVPPLPEDGLSDEQLLKRLGGLYSEAFVGAVAKELESARKEGDEAMVAEIRARFTYRMHDLSEFMKTLSQRFTRWFNREHGRRGTLWEERYKSVIVESGVAARTMAAYIDLNPVRAGMCSDPADYRWSGYGEVVELAGSVGRGIGNQKVLHFMPRVVVSAGAFVVEVFPIAVADGELEGPCLVEGELADGCVAPAQQGEGCWSCPRPSRVEFHGRPDRRRWRRDR